MANTLNTAPEKKIYRVSLSIVFKLNNPKKYCLWTLKIHNYLIFQKTRKYIIKDYYPILVAAAAEIIIIKIITAVTAIITIQTI